MRESRNLEYKSDISNTFLKTVSAFSNYDGGTIIFGVNNSGEVLGLDDIDQKCLNIENRINDGISPVPDYSISVTNSGMTISLEVRPGHSKPYLYRSKAYRRSDTATVEVDATELRRLILSGENLDYEELPSKEQSLQFSVLEKEFRAKIGIEQFTLDTLKTLNLYSDRSGFNNAAAILSDTNSYPGIDIVKFGESVNILQKRRTYEHRSIIESFYGAVSMFRDYYCYDVIDGIERKRVESIPEEAFREALANAIVHRTWDVSSQIRISMFNDRVELSSVGGLPFGVTVENYLNGRVSVLRNPILAGVFHRLGFIEKFGTGILRIKEAYSSSVSRPSFYVDDDLIQVTLPLILGQRDLTDDELSVYNVLSIHTAKSISEIMKSYSFTFGKSKVLNILKALSDRGIIDVIGSGRGTKYRIVS